MAAILVMRPALCLCVFISLYLQAYIHNLSINSPVVTEKRKFDCNTKLPLGQGQEITLTLNTHLSSLERSSDHSTVFNLHAV